MSDHPLPVVDAAHGHKDVAAVRPQDACEAISGKPGAKPPDWPKELGGPKGPEPTRYGDWEQKGRCSDF